MLTGTILGPSTAEERPGRSRSGLFLSAEAVLRARVAAAVSRLFDVVDGASTLVHADVTGQPPIQGRSLTEQPTEADRSYLGPGAPPA